MQLTDAESVAIAEQGAQRGALHGKPLSFTRFPRCGRPRGGPEPHGQHIPPLLPRYQVN